MWSMRCSALELTPSGISHATRVRALIQAIQLMLQPKRCSLTLTLYVSLSLSLSLPTRAWNMEEERGGGWQGGGVMGGGVKVVDRGMDGSMGGRAR